MSDIVLGLRGAKIIKTSPCLPRAHDWYGMEDMILSHISCDRFLLLGLLLITLKITRIS